MLLYRARQCNTCFALLDSIEMFANKDCRTSAEQHCQTQKAKFGVLTSTRLSSLYLPSMSESLISRFSTYAPDGQQQLGKNENSFWGQCIMGTSQVTVLFKYEQDQHSTINGILLATCCFFFFSIIHVPWGKIPCFHLFFN